GKTGAMLSPARSAGESGAGPQGATGTCRRNEVTEPNGDGLTSGRREGASRSSPHRHEGVPAPRSVSLVQTPRSQAPAWECAWSSKLCFIRADCENSQPTKLSFAIQLRSQARAWEREGVRNSQGISTSYRFGYFHGRLL